MTPSERAIRFAQALNSRLVYQGFTHNAPFTTELLQILTDTVADEVRPLFERLDDWNEAARDRDIERD
jgi:hypothetical protein